MMLGLVAIGVVVGVYVSALRGLAAARQARRDDDCAAADGQLAACWRLPGLAGAVRLENELQGLQQGDLADEERWRARAARNSSEGALVLEALAKGNLASFQFNE